MKNIVIVLFLVSFITACDTDNGKIEGEFEFVKMYSAEITVGGVVGTIERKFEVGEVYGGTDEGIATITIKIAEHSELNENCPNNLCYQEFLRVPRGYLKLVE